VGKFIYIRLEYLKTDTEQSTVRSAVIGSSVMAPDIEIAPLLLIFCLNSEAGWFIGDHVKVF